MEMCRDVNGTVITKEEGENNEMYTNVRTLLYGIKRFVLMLLRS